MSVPNELAVGYSIIALGVVLLLAPALLRVADPIAPDASMTMGESLAYQSVELRREKRLPLRRKFTILPNRGLVGGSVVLLLLVPLFVMVNQHDLARGIYVHLVSRNHSGVNENCLEGPIVVSLRQKGEVSQLLLNGSEISREQLGEALKSKLAGRANWEVFIEGDQSAPFAEPMYAIDAVNTLHAKAVILTPKLRDQIARDCPSR